jgi:hypothetical protein
MQEPTLQFSGEGCSRWDGTSEWVPLILPGYWRWHVRIGDRTQHGKRHSVILAVWGSTGNSREPGRAIWGGGEARSTDEAG